MPNPTFLKLVDDLETAVGAWENTVGRLPIPFDAASCAELNFYIDLRATLDTHYAEVARR